MGYFAYSEEGTLWFVSREGYVICSLEEISRMGEMYLLIYTRSDATESWL